MIYYYSMSYKEDTDDFYGVVETGTANGSVIVFEIQNTSEMCRMIRNKIMSHVDDVKGLETYLRDYKKIRASDQLILLGSVKV